MATYSIFNKKMFRFDLMKIVMTMVKKIFVFTAFVFTLFAGGAAFSQEIPPQNMERLHIMEDSLVSVTEQ